MKFIVAKQSCSMSFFGQSYDLRPLSWPEINPEHILVAPDGLAVSIVRRYPTALSLIDFDSAKLPGFPRRLERQPTELQPGTRLLLLRDAGLGDALTMTPLVEYLNRLDPRPRVRLATLKARHELLRHLDCELLPLPLHLAAILDQADYYVDFHDPQGICEDVEMIDFNLVSLNIAPTSLAAEFKQPSINPALCGDPATTAAIAALANQRPRILCAPGASDRLRTLPPEVLRPIFEHWPQVAFLVTGEIPSDLPANVFALDTSSALSAFVSAIAACDALISADSAAYHIAAALKKPALAIFGPVPSKIRSGYYPHVISLDAAYSGEVCCSPCFIHGHLYRQAHIAFGTSCQRALRPGCEIVRPNGQKFNYDPTRGCPEMQALGRPCSPCLESITPKRLLAAFSQVLEMVGSLTQEKR